MRWRSKFFSFFTNRDGFAVKIIHKGDKERQWRKLEGERGLHSFNGTLQVCPTAELSKSALCRCQVEKECLRRLCELQSSKAFGGSLCGIEHDSRDSEILIYEAT